MMKFRAIAIATVALGGSLGLMGAEAVAAPSTVTASVQEVGVMAAVPSCVKVTKTHQDEGYKAFKVKNNCSGTKRLKGIFKYGYDSSCHSVKKGKTDLLSSTQPWVGYDKVVTC
ncbi:hypothetical protein ACIBI8_28175 [Streptomyces sp. NPDC050529]|uniref:hypothetical protein n=1 Tax=unclassified Streptomyces TaxID=2593676 RepID=UPI002DD9428B|nr:hypothetical protein [Streptomyces sp. NBC_01022]MEE4494593.1 hypothetical protein [Streptomyces sp. BE230]WRZ84467.1 hypothetical protein OG316_31520 [Streptomyces sp. NBC_01022]